MQHQRFARLALPLVTVLFVVLVPACKFLPTQPSTQPSISSLVLARDVKPGTFDPIEETDVYSWEQPQFHALVRVADAPAGTLVRAVWTAVDVGDAAAPNTQVAEDVKEARGTLNLHFTAVPDYGRWPPGSYKLKVYLNGKLDRTVNFTVVAAQTSMTHRASVCPPISPPALYPSEIIQGVTMTLDVDEKTKEPLNPTSVFPPSAVFHAVVAVQDAPDDTTVSASWYATDLGDVASCNLQLLRTDVVVDVSRNVDFSLTSKIPWPEGRYRVEIAVNDALAELVTFEVGSESVEVPSQTRQP
jgi:hypothetical protein